MPVVDHDEDAQELYAYYDFLIVASRKSPASFAEKTRTDVVYSQLIRQPAQYRGQVIHVQGRLARLLRHEAPVMLKLGGVSDLYEAWIYDEISRTHPYCVVFTELPPGLQTGDKLSKMVSCDAFFFKKGDYADPQRDGQRLIAPLLVAHTLKVQGAAADDLVGARGGEMAVVFLGFLVLVAIAAVMITWWFRRNDRLMQARLRQARTGEFVPPPSDPVPMAQPVGPIETEESDRPAE